MTSPANRRPPLGDLLAEWHLGVTKAWFGSMDLMRLGSADRTECSWGRVNSVIQLQDRGRLSGQ